MILAWSVSIVLASYTSTRRRLKGNGSPLYFSPFFLLIDFDLFTLTTALLSFIVSYFLMFKITFLAFFFPGDLDFFEITDGEFLLVTFRFRVNAGEVGSSAP